VTIRLITFILNKVIIITINFCDADKSKLVQRKIFKVLNGGSLNFKYYLYIIYTYYYTSLKKININIEDVPSAIYRKVKFL